MTRNYYERNRVRILAALAEKRQMFLEQLHGPPAPRICKFCGGRQCDGVAFDSVVSNKQGRYCMDCSVVPHNKKYNKPAYAPSAPRRPHPQRCRSCLKRRPLEAFPVRKRNATGRSMQCLTCLRTYTAKSAANARLVLTDSYVRKIIADNLGRNARKDVSGIPLELVNAKRRQLSIYRSIREVKHVIRKKDPKAFKRGSGFTSDNSSPRN